MLTAGARYVTSSFVLDESYTLLLHRAGHHVAVEVISPSDRYTDVEDKVVEWLEGRTRSTGAKLLSGWQLREAVRQRRKEKEAMSTRETSNAARNIEADRAGLAWQLGIWDQYAPLYAREVDTRFIPVVEQVIARATLRPGQRVLDLGTGTGSVAIRAASLVAPGGQVLGVDL